MKKPIAGIHHVTAIAGEPQRNLDFYTEILGLRLVKATVNFDDPGTYHLYFGDELGRPGTLLTFFPYVNGYQGKRGTGQLTVTSFSIPEGSLDYWIDRFAQHDVEFYVPVQRFDEEVLTFFDRDGLQMELVVHARTNAWSSWEKGPIPAEQAIRGFYGVTLSEKDVERTAPLLTETLGFRFVQQLDNRFRYAVGEGEGTQWVDVLYQPSVQSGRVSVGTVHHIAWRSANDEEEEAWQQSLTELGYHVTPIMERQYFRSIYFREPGGVLFEIATDGPGFAIDESPTELGMHLKLPYWLESTRPQIEKRLPQIKTKVWH